ncbi:hypothetical protein D1872_207020 [compost metagenome]
MQTLLCSLQIIGCTLRNDFFLMGDIGSQNPFKSKLLRTFICDDEHIKTIRNLQIGFFE